MCRSLPSAGYFKVFVSNCWISSPISLIHLPIFVSKPNTNVSREQVESTTCIARAWCIGISKQRMFYWPNGLRQPWWPDCIFVELVNLEEMPAFSGSWEIFFLESPKVLFVREGFKKMMSNFIVKPGCWANRAAKFVNFHVRTLRRLLLVKGCNIWDDLCSFSTNHPYESRPIAAAFEDWE